MVLGSNRHAGGSAVSALSIISDALLRDHGRNVVSTSRQTDLVENFFCQIKEFCRIATRYDETDTSLSEQSPLPGESQQALVYKIRRYGVKLSTNPLGTRSPPLPLTV
jgi:hypothetical protein